MVMCGCGEPVPEIMSVKRLDQMIALRLQLDNLASDLEEEMFRRGGPQDIEVFFGPLE